MNKLILKYHQWRIRRASKSYAKHHDELVKEGMRHWTTKELIDREMPFLFQEREKEARNDDR